MRRAFLVWLTCALLGAAPAAFAQRTPVPVMNFEAIPVSLSTAKPLTAEQVRGAWVAAGSITHWEIVPKQPGVLEATFRKGDKHMVVVEVTYDAEKYSTRYVSSVNMKYGIEERSGTRFDGRTGLMVSASADRAANKQKEYFTSLPETAYAKPDPKAVIHPFYERWLHDLLSAVRGQLRTIE